MATRRTTIDGRPPDAFSTSSGSTSSGSTSSGISVVVVRLHAPDCTGRSEDPSRRTAREQLHPWRLRGLPVVAVADHARAWALFDLRALLAFQQDARHEVGPFDALVVGRSTAATTAGTTAGTVAPRCGCERPEPSVYDAAARAMRTEPSRCLALVDALPDLHAASAAGLAVLLLADGVGPTDRLGPPARDEQYATAGIGAAR